MTVGRILENDIDKGSGFALATSPSRTTRVVLTAKHVVGNQEPSSLQFFTEDKRRIPVERVEWDNDLDVAILHLSEDVAKGLVVGRAVEGGSWQVETQPRPNDPKLYGTITDTHRRFIKRDGGHEIYVLQLYEKQNLGDYKGYSGSPVVLKSPTDVVIGVLIEQLRSRLSVPPSQPKPATNVLYAIPIQDVLDRFSITAVSAALTPPSLAADLPASFVPRPHEFAMLKASLLQGPPNRPTAITSALLGAGGYGKTTLALALCHDQEIQNAFPGGILWVTLGEKSGDLIGKIEDLVYHLRGERPGSTSREAAAAEFKKALADRACLLVIDDVWYASDLVPFLQGGPHCARLITTRSDQVLPLGVETVPVEAMRQDEAVQLLQTGLVIEPAGKEAQLVQQLAQRLGKWPLLLTLANGVLRERVGRLREPLGEALASLQNRLEKKGVVAFDARNAQERSEAVKKTIEVSLEQLGAEEQARFEELAIFPEDVTIPLATVHHLWQATGKLEDELDTEDLCQRLYSLSLLQSYDLLIRSIRLHDVIRNYLWVKMKPCLSTVHSQFLDSYSVHRWADLPPQEPYLWNHLIEHLSAAGKDDALKATVKDLRYLAAKACFRGVAALEQDLFLTSSLYRNDSILEILKDQIARIAHLLRKRTLREVEEVLLIRLAQVESLGALCKIWEREMSSPWLKAWHPLPDLHDSALLRTLRGHRNIVDDCAISPESNFIVSASFDGTLVIWNAKTGTPLRTLTGHSDPVMSCAISSDGNFIVSVDSDAKLIIWDARTGAQLQTLTGHSDAIYDCAVSPDGSFIVSASDDGTLIIWDANTGIPLRTLTGHTKAVGGCAVSPDGSFIVSASDDGTLIIWDANTGIPLRTLTGHSDAVHDCAISPDSSFIVSASDDGTLIIWDTKTGTQLRTLTGHTDAVVSCAVSPDGSFIVSVSSDAMLIIWDARIDTQQQTFISHSDAIYDCAVSPDGSFIVSASNDKTLIIWDANTGISLRTLIGHTKAVVSCAVSSDGSFIVSASDDGTLIIWDANTGTPLRTVEWYTWKLGIPVPLHRMGCVVSSDDCRIILAVHNGTLIVYDARTGKQLQTFKGHRGVVYDCAMSPDNSFVVSASNDKTLIIWDANTGTSLRTLTGHTDAVVSCAVSPDGSFIVSGAKDGTLIIWDANTGKQLRTLTGHSSVIYDCAISPDGRWVISVSYDEMLRWWSVQDGSCVATFSAQHTLRCCAFLPDGSHLVTGEGRNFYFLQAVW